MLRVLPILALLACAGCAPAVQGVPSGPPYSYEVVLPRGYAERPAERFPLILFLHGGGGLIPRDHPIPVYARDNPDFPFIVVAPSTREEWSAPRLDALLRQLRDRYRVDPDRIYLTGLSAGAFGAFRFAAAHPDHFAAVALVAGGGDVEQACTLRGLPVWIFHNRTDPVVPVEHSERLAAALRRCGADRVRVSIEDAPDPSRWAHDAWSAAYLAPDLYEWFLAHRR